MGPSLAHVCFAATGRGLEGVLAQEARALGRTTPVPGGVEVVGTTGVHEEACLRLRTANRVLLRLARIRVRRWADAAHELERVDLSTVASGGEPVWLEPSVRLPGAPATAALRSWLAKAWQRRVEAAAGEDRASPGTRLVLRLVDGDGTLSADASGELLFRRGWRQEVGRAPMRETLAAGVLALAGWRVDEPIWDPLCGSGTLVIEAALRARRVVPGGTRAFAFERWPGTDARAWVERRERAVREALPEASVPIHGSDLNAGALGTVRRNARRAGVFDSLVLERADIRTVTPGPVPPGLLVTNLPYGRRAGERSELDAVFRAVDEALRVRFAGWRAALLTEEPERLERAFGRSPDALHPLDNGGLHVALCVFPPARS